MSWLLLLSLLCACGCLPMRACFCCCSCCHCLLSLHLGPCLPGDTSSILPMCSACTALGAQCIIYGLVFALLLLLKVML